MATSEQPVKTQWRLVLFKPDSRYERLLTELGFRRAKNESGNWSRAFYETDADRQRAKRAVRTLNKFNIAHKWFKGEKPQTSQLSRLQERLNQAGAYVGPSPKDLEIHPPTNRAGGRPNYAQHSSLENVD